MTRYHVVSYDPATNEFTSFLSVKRQEIAEEAMERIRAIFPGKVFTIAPVQHPAV